MLNVLSAAIATVVTIAEILKNNGFAVEKSWFFCLFTSIITFVLACECELQSILILGGFSVWTEIATSTVDINESGGRPVQKAKVFAFGHTLVDFYCFFFSGGLFELFSWSLIS